MQKSRIYEILPSESFSHAILKQDARYSEQLRRISYDEALIDGWIEPVFQWKGGRSKSRPNITTTFFSSWMVRSDVVDVIRSSSGDVLEFLPAKVDGEQWYVVNIIGNVIKKFNVQNSDFLISEWGGDIFWIKRIQVAREDWPGSFCLVDRSNRSQYLFDDSFVEMANNEKLAGVFFREIGSIV